MAISDAEGVTCRPLSILTEREIGRVTAAVAEIAIEHRAEKIVVGMPRPLSGGTNEQLEDVLQFVERLRLESALPVTTWDERFTSVLAERGRKGALPVDAVAACYMLQNYLDRLSHEERS